MDRDVTPDPERTYGVSVPFGGEKRGVLVPLEVALARQSPDHKPRVGLLGVRSKWDPKRKRWMFRGVVKRRGKQLPTSWVEDPYQAARDYVKKAEEIDAKQRAEKVGITAWPTATLGEALDVSVAMARMRGVSEYTIRSQWMTERRVLCRYIDPQTPLAELDVYAIIRFVRAARSSGRSDTTIKTKDLFQLEHAFRAVGLPSPVPAAKAAIANLRAVEKRLDVLTLDEAREIIAKVRASDPTEFPAAQRSADIFEVTLYTGIRAGEWGRLKRDDIDPERCMIHIRHAKNRARPRRQPVIERLRPALERLKASADPESGLIIPGGMGTIGTTCTKWRERLNEPRFRGLRSLRHCVATALAHGGTPLVDISALLGHTSITTTARYVARLEQGERLRKAVEGLDG